MVRVDILFNSISVISGRCAGDNKRLYAMEPHLRLKRFPPQAGIERGITGKIGMYLHVLTHVSMETEEWSQGVTIRPHQWDSGVLFPLNLLILYIVLIVNSGYIIILVIYMNIKIGKSSC